MNNCRERKSTGLGGGDPRWRSCATSRKVRGFDSRRCHWNFSL